MHMSEKKDRNLAEIWLKLAKVLKDALSMVQ